ncbi:MAG: hypothetical protein ABI442_13095, partial [Gemmatimonadaceae bacterium]
MTNPLDARLAAIERAIALLSAEVSKIRAELKDAPTDVTEWHHGARFEPARPAERATGRAPSPPPPLPPPSLPQRPPRQRPIRAANISAAQFENLVGRYG